MTEKSASKYKWPAELKAIFLMLFLILGFAFVEDNRLLIFALVATGLLILVNTYIDRNDLKLSASALSLFMAFYNVASLFYMVQYFGDKNTTEGIYGYVFYPFIQDKSINIGYVIWIFVLTLFILILRMQAGRPSGEKYGR